MTEEATWVDARSEHAEFIDANVNGLAMLLLEWTSLGGDPRLGVRAILAALRDSDPRFATAIRRLGVDNKAIGLAPKGNITAAAIAWGEQQFDPENPDELCPAALCWLRTSDPGVMASEDRMWAADSIDRLLGSFMVEAAPWLANGGNPELLIRFLLAALGGMGEPIRKAIRQLGVAPKWLSRMGPFWVVEDNGSFDLYGPHFDELDPGATPREGLVV